MTREDILASLGRTYRLYRRVELSLDKAPLNRKFKNPKCKSALAVAEKRKAVVADKDTLAGSLYLLWGRLPEVRNGGVDNTIENALCFAATLIKRKRRPKYLKNQRQLAIS